MYTWTYIYNQSFHQYSYGFQNLMSSFKIWCQVGGRGQKFQIWWDGWDGWDGWTDGTGGRVDRWDGLDGPEKCPLNFFILYGYIDYVYICLYTKWKLSPTFSWDSKFDVKLGWGSKFSHLQQVGDFSIFGSKSKVFQKHPTL